MIRLLYDHEFFSAFGYSGITRYFLEVIRRVSAAEGFRASLFMGFHLNEFVSEEFTSDLDRFFGMRRPRIPRTGRLFNALNLGLLPLFAKAARADIFHQTYYAPLLSGFKGKRIVTVYDMTYERFPNLFPAGEAAARMKSEAIARADGIIAISESTKRDVMRILGISGERIRTLHLGNSLHAEPGPAPRVAGSYILYVGQRVPHKNFGALLRAWSGHAGLRESHNLVCFGGHPFTEAETSEFRARGVEGKVIRLSGPDALLANLYRYATVLAYPSLYEGFGLPVLEAMGLGCPVIASGVSSLPEVAGEAALYFDPRSESEIVSALDKVTANADLRTRLSEAGKVRALSFSWDACARGHMEYYQEIAGGG